MLGISNIQLILLKKAPESKSWVSPLTSPVRSPALAVLSSKIRDREDEEQTYSRLFSEATYTYLLNRVAAHWIGQIFLRILEPTVKSRGFLGKQQEQVLHLRQKKDSSIH